MLIDSPRLTPQDRAHWATLERYDALLARNPRWPEREARAIATIRDFAEAGPCYASTSWGKDSVVVTHLLALSGIHIPLVWVRVRHWENPDCLAVRDKMLHRHPSLRDDYHEIEVEATAARWWQPEAEHQKATARTSRGGFDVAAQRYGARHISGVRGEESRIRGLVMSRWGEAGPSACRPIGYWTAADVFAYLHRYNLPIHPAYAMTAGGQHDRRWLRVSSLGGIRGADKNRAEWETAYYGDTIAAGRKATGHHDAQRIDHIAAELHVLTDPR